jgi:hypothetical protein
MYEPVPPFDLYRELPNNKHFFSMTGIGKIRKNNITVGTFKVGSLGPSLGTRSKRRDFQTYYNSV